MTVFGERRKEVVCQLSLALENLEVKIRPYRTELARHCEEAILDRLHLVFVRVVSVMIIY